MKNIFKSKIIKNLKNEENSWEIYKGAIKSEDEISPTYINLNNPKYIEINETFFSGINP